MKRLLVTALITGLLFLTVGACQSQAAEPASRYVAGSYQAEATGYGGNLTVTVDFSQDQLLSVTVAAEAETAGIGQEAATQLAADITAAQTWEVDGISQATVTSDAIKTAVKACMEQAAATR